jgi:signal transduction histidine kinase
MAASPPDVLWALPVALCRFNADGRLVQVNPVMRAVLGLPPAELATGRSRGDLLLAMAEAGLLGPGDPAELAAAVARHQPPAQLRWCPPDGRGFDLHLTRLTDGGLLVCLIDTSAADHRARQAEHAAASSNRTLRAVLNGLEEGLAVAAADGRLTLLNPAFNQLLGLPGGANDFDSLVALIEAHTDPLGIAVPGSLAAALRAGTGGVVARRRPDGLMLGLKLGHLADGAHRLQVCRMPASAPRPAKPQLANPAPAEPLVTTALPAPAAALAAPSPAALPAAADASQAIALARLLDRVQHGLAIWDAEGRLVVCNRAASALLDSPADLLQGGRRFADVVAALHAEGAFGEGAKAARQSSELVQQVSREALAIEHGMPDGRRLTLQSEPVTGGGFVTAHAEQPEQPELHQPELHQPELHQPELHQPELRQDEPAAQFTMTKVTAPDLVWRVQAVLRAPVATVSGLASALLHEAADQLPATRAVAYATAFGDAGQELTDLLEALLDVARIEAGHFVLDETAMDVGALVRDCAAQAQPSARGAGLDLSCQLASTLPLLRGDPRLLSQVLTHLLVNAVKFTLPGGVVLVEAGLARSDDVTLADLDDSTARLAGERFGNLAEAADVRGRDMILRVSDSGRGIGTDELARIFDPFAIGLDRTAGMPTRFRRRGLGLYLCRALIQAHGGRLLLHSAPGEGTTALLVLPAGRLVPPTAPQTVPEMVL